MRNKFDFFEIVKINFRDVEHAKINDTFGVVLGMSQNDDSTWGYAVVVNEETWDLHESLLISTGAFANKDEIYSDQDCIKVLVKKNGEGIIK